MAYSRFEHSPLNLKTPDRCVLYSSTNEGSCEVVVVARYRHHVSSFVFVDVFLRQILSIFLLVFFTYIRLRPHSLSFLRLG